MSAQQHLSAIGALKSAMQTFMSRPWYCVGVYLLIGLIGAFGGMVFEVIEAFSASSFSTFTMFFAAFATATLGVLGELIKFGFKRSALHLARQQDTDYTDVIISSGLGVRFLVGWVLYNFLVVGLPIITLVASVEITGADPAMIMTTTTGILLLLIIAGLSVFLALLFHLFPFVLLDSNAGILQSLQYSSRITRGSLPELLLFYLVVALLNMIGFLLAAIGLLVTLPLTVLAQASVYDQLSTRTTN